MSKEIQNPIVRRFKDFSKFIPFNQTIHLEIVDGKENWILGRLKYNEKLVGDPDTGILHGGAITTLMDATCAGSVFVGTNFIQIATLDLRIDYLKPATPPKDVLAKCECYKVTKNIAFARGIAYHEDINDPIANASATFILSSKDTYRPFRKTEPQKQTGSTIEGAS